jgi:MoaA/NifB/PqqE/SkfB family radical SAM enzyme
MFGAERTVGKVANWLTSKPFAYPVLASEPVYHLFRIGISAYVRSLRNPTNATLLGKLDRAEQLGSSFLPNEQERIFESQSTSILKQDLETSITNGTDTNSTQKLKRTLYLMGEKYLRIALLDFMVVNFGLGTLKDRLLAKQGMPSFHYLTLQVNSECNAKPRCPGCFAERDKGKLSFDTLDQTQHDAIALASRLTIIVGGEPLLEKESLFKLLRKYNRTPYLLATNGILLDDDCAEEMADLGNVITFINTPGLESTTNTVRRNPNAWNQIQSAAENLQRHHAASGFISTVTQANFREVSSGKFVKQMVNFGMMLGFYFAYTNPLSCSPQEELALTHTQTQEFSQRIKEVSGQYPMYLVDTTNGREKLIGGCPAGRTALIYVQSDGRVAGCPMVPQTNAELNVNRLSLTKILQSSYFQRVRKERPSCLRTLDLLSKTD